MTDRPAPTINKLPFLAADGVLLGLACWILASQPHPLGTWPLVLLTGCVAAGAWFLVTPFLAEYRALVKFAESDSLAETVAQIENLQSLGEQITRATAQWQTVQEHSGKSVAAAKEIGDKMAVEARQFAEFMQKANDSEKAHLRLEVEKLRRVEGEWLQLVVHLLDHVFALHQAAARSGQPNLREQMTNFQNACRDVARRIGLVAFEAAAGEPFDEGRHQLAEAEASPPAGAIIASTLAAGFTYQGQLIRRSLVALASSEPSPAELPAATEEMTGASTADSSKTVGTSPEPNRPTAPEEEESAQLTFDGPS